MKKSIAFLLMITAISAAAQQPQTQKDPIYGVNAKYANGVAPGYAPTAGSGLTLNLGGGTANCGGAIAVYIAGTLTMTASTTNYVYLNTSASCVPAVKTTAFTSSDIPLATVVASSSAITSITDDRTMFQQPGSGTVTSPVTFAASGGASPGASYNGSAPVTVSAATVGAAAAPVNWIDETGNFNVSANHTYYINCPSGCTATLPSTIAVFGPGGAGIINAGAGAVTITSAGPTYTGVTSLLQGSSLYVGTDGTNYDSSGVVTYGSGLSAARSALGVALSATGAGGSTAGVFPIDNYGGVPDGNLSANTGTDNTSAWSAAYSAATSAGGGTITFDCNKQYRFSGAGPSSATPYIGIASTAPYCFSTVFTSSASATVVTMNGASETSKINNASSQWMLIGRAVAPSSGAIGLQVTNTNQALVNETVVTDSPICFDIYDDPFNGFGGFTNNVCLWGYEGISWSASTAVGFNLRGGTGTNGFYGFQSLYGHNNFVNINPSFATITTSYGHKASGNIVDLNWDYPSTATGINFPLYVVGATNPNAQDVHITNLTADRCLTECAYINVPSANGIEISGGTASWMTLVDSAQTAGIEIYDTPNVILKDFQAVLSQDIPMFKIDGGSTGVIIKDSQCTLGYGSVSHGQCLYANGSNNIGLDHVLVSGSSRTGFALPAFQYVNTSNGTVTGVNMSLGTGVPFNFDANSNNNRYWNLNNSLAGWGTVVDAGTGNSFNSPTTSGTPTIGHCVDWASPTSLGDSGSSCGSSGGGGAWTNLTGTVTAANCTVSGSTCTISTPANDVVFSSIPAGYNHIVVTWMGRTSDGTSNVQVGMQINSDTGSHYNWNGYGQQAGGSTSVGFNQPADTKLAVANFPANTATANYAGSGTIWIYNYTNTSFYKLTAATNNNPFGSSGSQFNSYNLNGQWLSASAITALTIYDVGGGNFVAGTTFSIYGVN